MLWHLDTLSVDWKNLHIDMVSLHEKEEEPNGRYKDLTLVGNPKSHISLVAAL